MGLQKIYRYLAEENEYINRVYEKKKSDNREDFEKHKIKYWCWLIKLNMDYKVFKKDILKENHYVEKKKENIKNNKCVEKKKEVLNQPLIKDFVSHFDFIRGIWQFKGATDELVAIFEALDQSFECWQKENNLIWLIYVSVLLERENTEKAEEVLHKYIKRHGLKDIERFVLVSEFAIDLGINSIEIRRTVGIWKTLKSNVGRKNFENWIKSKTIAIVGNSGVELGKNRGEEIDSHDIVIRINNYSLAKYETDYGKKTDVWFREGKNEIKERNITEIHNLIYEPDFEHNIINKNMIDVLSRNVSTYPFKVLYLDYDIKSNFRNESGITNPTPDILVIWYIYKVLGSLENVDIYDLSFMEEKIETAHYYDGFRLSKDYDLFSEKEFVEKLYNKNEISLSKKKNNSNCEIFVCAYREFDIKKGATGGPGGVCYMQQELVGNRYRNISISYLFKESKVEREIINASQGLDPIVKKLSWAAEYILTNRVIANGLKKNKKVLFICHDIGSAYGAYLLGCDYVIVYHQQGSLVNEAKIFSVELSDDEQNIIQYIETIVFRNAYKVFFPSKGSQNVFKKTTLISQDDLDKVHFADYPLYNTISNVTERLDVINVLQELNISKLYNTDKEIFISVADYNYDKGVDRIPDFLTKYVLKTGKKVVWIAIGNASNQELFNSLLQDKENWNFEAYLYGNRIEHNKVLELYEWADYYIMLHRNSIFDLATLEAMRAGNAVILSNAGSNYEFNVCDNVLIVDCDHIEEAIEKMQKKDINEWKMNNNTVFHEYFSNEQFRLVYTKMIDDFYKNCAIEEGEKYSKINSYYLSKWRDRYQGKKVVICGSGSSLDHIEKQDKEYMYIALNKALFFNKINFDFAFMQDYPRNQEYTLEDYNSYNCTKFYGIITNPNIKVKGLGGDGKKFDNVIGEICRYELSPIVYDYRFDQFNEDIALDYFSDAQSVLFSALQFAVFAGFKEIKLCGVDFSDVNYGNTENLSNYAENVSNNLIAFKKQLKERHPEIDFGFLYTTNRRLEEKICTIDHKGEKVLMVK